MGVAIYQARCDKPPGQLMGFIGGVEKVDWSARRRADIDDPIAARDDDAVRNAAKISPDAGRNGTAAPYSQGLILHVAILN